MNPSSIRIIQKVSESNLRQNRAIPPRRNVHANEPCNIQEYSEPAQYQYEQPIYYQPPPQMMYTYANGMLYPTYYHPPMMYAPYQFYATPTTTHFQPPRTYRPYRNIATAAVQQPKQKFDTRGINHPAENQTTEVVGEGELDATALISKNPINVHLTVEQFHDAIMKHLEQHRECRVSWLNRMLARSQSLRDFKKCMHVFNTYHQKAIQVTPETGTLLVKAACRAEVPERALQLLKDVEKVRLFPTLGGIHYLMINFSIKKDTQSVIQTYEVAKIRKIQPNARTFHILIRECIDNGLMEDAMLFLEECKSYGITPSRVTYNILMNGCRRGGNAERILSLREEMAKDNIEINDTTVKFTVLAHMMLGHVDKAVQTFKEYELLPERSADDVEETGEKAGEKVTLESFSNRFFVVSKEDNLQKRLVLDLFDALKKQGIQLPPAIETKLDALMHEPAPEEAAATTTTEAQPQEQKEQQEQPEQQQQ